MTRPEQSDHELEQELAPETVFDRITQTLDPPLLVVTAANGRERAGCVVGFHAQCSLDPLRYAIWLSKANRTYRVALDSEYLGIHLLGAGNHRLGKWFGGHSGDDVDTFADVAVDLGPGGVPLLRGVPGRFAGRRVSLFDDDEGDHACFVVEPGPGHADEPDSAETPGSGEGLLTVSGLSDVEPGH